MIYDVMNYFVMDIIPPNGFQIGFKLQFVESRAVHHGLQGD